MQNKKLHIVMLPWLGFGHMIPHLELAKRLAQMGHRISFLSTPRNIDRLLPNVPHSLRPQLHFVKLTPPAIEGLPEDAQSTNDVSFDGLPLIMRLQDGMEAPLRGLLKDKMNPFQPDWIIYDLFHYWAPAVAADYGIPSVLFTPFSAMSLCFFRPTSVPFDSTVPGESSTQQMTTPPWITKPTNIGWRYHDVVRTKKILRSTDSVTGITINHRLGKALQGCNAAAIRSCIDLEPEWIPLLSQLWQKPIFPCLLSPSVSETSSTGDGETHAVLEWLDKQKAGSVVYVAFGSEWQLNREEAHEVAFGLEQSELPFFWAYKGDTDLLPPGFQERNKTKGLVHVGWASQPRLRLLAHRSIGCFFMHGGWGSTVEGLTFGKPLILLPNLSDQGLTARGMAEKKVGVEVPRKDEDGSFERDAITKSLKLVMLEEGGELIRSNALQMMKIFRDEKRNNEYVQEFVNYLIQNRRQNSMSVPLA